MASWLDTRKNLNRGQEMGKDALRVLNQYISLFATVRSDLEKELPQVQAATKLVAHWV